LLSKKINSTNIKHDNDKNKIKEQEGKK